MMESEINQSSVGASENDNDSSTTKEPEMKRRRQDPLGEDYENNLPVSAENSLNIGDELRKIHEKLESQSVELGTMKTENKLLLAKVDLLQVQNAELQAKLKVSELEMKQTNEQMTKAMETKMAEQIGQLAEKLQKAVNRIGEQDQKMELMKSETAEEVGKLQRQFNDAEAKMAGKDREVTQVNEDLEKMAKQLEELSTQLGGKMTILGSQAVDGQNKLEEMLATLEALNLSLWRNNRWNTISNQEHAQLSADGLTVVNKTVDHFLAKVRAKLPISRAIFAHLPELKLVYWEVRVENEKSLVSAIGWIGPNVPLNDDEGIGYHPDSFGINCIGDYWESGSLPVEGYGNEFCVGDVVGSGITRGGKLFFTRNGQLNGEPIILKHNQDLLLYPAAQFGYSKDIEMEANFGADLEKKPFIFDIDAHETQLFH